jgi:hypothetical protein
MQSTTNYGAPYPTTTTNRHHQQPLPSSNDVLLRGITPGSTRVKPTNLDLNLNLSLLERRTHHPNPSLHQPERAAAARGTGARGRADSQKERIFQEGKKGEGRGKKSPHVVSSPIPSPSSSMLSVVH